MGEGQEIQRRVRKSAGLGLGGVGQVYEECWRRKDLLPPWLTCGNYSVKGSCPEWPLCLDAP